MLQSGCICQAGDSACISSTLLQDLLVVPICISLAAPALLPLLLQLFYIEVFHVMHEGVLFRWQACQCY